MKKKLELATDETYKNLVEVFQRLRKANEAHGGDIQKATKTGGGRVYRFEALEYSPRLDTFLKWCWAAGIKVSLNHAPKKPNLRKFIRKRDAEANGPEYFIDDINENFKP